LSQRIGLCNYPVQAVFYSSILTTEKGACPELQRPPTHVAMVVMGL